jgi:hypothetical protein
MAHHAMAVMHAVPHPAAAEILGQGSTLRLVELRRNLLDRRPRLPDRIQHRREALLALCQVRGEVAARRPRLVGGALRTQRRGGRAAFTQEHVPGRALRVCGLHLRLEPRQARGLSGVEILAHARMPGRARVGHGAGGMGRPLLRRCDHGQGQRHGEGNGGGDTGRHGMSSMGWRRMGV